MLELGGVPQPVALRPHEGEVIWGVRYIWTVMNPDQSLSQTEQINPLGWLYPVLFGESSFV
jgi:hypothetical protein